MVMLRTLNFKIGPNLFLNLQTRTESTKRLFKRTQTEPNFLSISSNRTKQKYFKIYF